MKPKDIVRHKITNEVGFIICYREDLNDRFDVQWSFTYDEDVDTLYFGDKALINQGCYSSDKLEVIYSV